MPATARAERNPYDHRHRGHAERLKRTKLGTPCPGGLVDGKPWRSDHCTGIMNDLEQMHADHDPPVQRGGTRANRVCCAPCNTGAGATAGNRARGPRRAARRSRTW